MAVRSLPGDRGFASVAKVTPPRIVGHFPRRCLFRLLDAARKRPVAFISAPAGSGKTMLVGSYIEARGLPCLWFRVDEGDTDPASFFYYLGLAAKRAAPRKKKPLPLLTPEYLPGLSVFSLRYFEKLYGRLPPGSVLVFDNCQKVPAESAVHDILREGLSILPKGMSAILVSRGVPPAAFARDLAHRSMEVIGWKDLRLTPEETEGIVRLRWKGKIPKETVRALHGKTDGWAAGLVLLLEQSHWRDTGFRKLAQRTPEKLFDYFGEEVFEAQEEGIRTFLLRSAYLPRMTVAMTERLTGESRSGQILSYLGRQNIFTSVHVHGEPVYEYHSLFREFLLSRAKAAYPAEEISRLQRAAAGLLAEQGQAEDAIALLQECGAWEDLCGLVLSQAPSLVSQGRFRTLEEWIRFLPEETAESVPWLLYWLGVCRLPIDPGESRGKFEQAYRQFRASGDVPGVLFSWSGVIESILYQFENFRTIDSWVAAIDDVLDASGGFPPGEIGDRIACSMIKAIALSGGASVRPEEGALIERAFSIARTSPDPSMKQESLIALYLYFQGRDFRKTVMVLGMARDLTELPDVPPVARIGWLEFDATHAIAQGAYDRSMNLVTTGLELAEASGIHLWDFFLMGQGALCCMITGDFAAANDFLRRMASSLGTVKPHGAGFYHYLAAWNALAGKDLAKALLQSELCLKRCEEAIYRWTMHLAHFQRAILFFESGADRQSAEHLGIARRVIPGEKSDYPEFSCTLAEAYFHLRRGNEEAALPLLREGLHMGRESGMYGLFMWYPGFLETLCAKALEAGIETEYVRELVRKNRLVPGDAQSGPEQWPWPVKIRTLGRFSILKNDCPLPYSRKVQQKPLLLLKTLIALGGRDVPEEQITDHLWPDSEGDLAHQAFTSTLRRLRHLLGEEKSLALKDGLLTLSGRHCWVDAFAFERILGNAEKRGREADREDGGETVPLLEKAIDLYEGSFLPEETKHPWAVSPRERLRNKFLRTVSALGGHWERAGKWEKAVNCYQRCLDVDNLAEEFYRRLMVCYRKLGRDAEAVSAYETCRKILSALLGIPPSLETEKVRRSLADPQEKGR